MTGKMLVVLMALVAMVSMVVAEDEGQDVGGPVLKMSCINGTMTIENVGTAYSDIGALWIAVDGKYIGVDVPNGIVLAPNPFIFTKDINARNYKWTTSINVTPGQSVSLTNGVGNYASCISA